MHTKFEHHKHSGNTAFCSKVSSGAHEAQCLMQTVSGCTFPLQSVQDKHICSSDFQRIRLMLISCTDTRQPLSRFLVADKTWSYSDHNETLSSSWWTNGFMVSSVQRRWILSIVIMVCPSLMLSVRTRWCKVQSCLAQLSDESKMHWSAWSVYIVTTKSAKGLQQPAKAMAAAQCTSQCEVCNMGQGQWATY